jgi:hypothetical protein
LILWLGVGSSELARHIATELGDDAGHGLGGRFRL